MAIIFNYLINFFSPNLNYEESYKSLYLIAIVMTGLISYLIIAIMIKAFKTSDIKLEY